MNGALGQQIFKQRWHANNVDNTKEFSKIITDASVFIVYSSEHCHK